MPNASFQWMLEDVLGHFGSILQAIWQVGLQISEMYGSLQRLGFDAFWSV